MKFNEVNGGDDCEMETSYKTNRIDEFDVYFKRAAEIQQQPQHHHLTTAAQQQQQQQQATCRRDSAPPDRRSSSTERRRSGGSVRHKRTSSCRYPQRRPTANVAHDQSLSATEHTPFTAGSNVHDQRQKLGQLCRLHNWNKTEIKQLNNNSVLCRWNYFISRMQPVLHVVNITRIELFVQMFKE